MYLTIDFLLVSGSVQTFSKFHKTSLNIFLVKFLEGLTTHPSTSLNIAKHFVQTFSDSLRNVEQRLNRALDVASLLLFDVSSFNRSRIVFLRLFSLYVSLKQYGTQTSCLDMLRSNKRDQMMCLMILISRNAL